MDQIIDNLYLGDAFDAVRLFKLPGDFVACLSIGAELIISQPFKDIFLAPKPFKHIIIQLDDRSKNLDQFIDDAVKFIDDNLSSGKVLVHCMAGVSRSPSIIFAYLISKGMKPIKAYDLIKDKRDKIDPYAGFIRDVLRHYRFPNNEIDVIMNYIKISRIKISGG